MSPQVCPIFPERMARNSMLQNNVIKLIFGNPYCFRKQLRVIAKKSCRLCLKRPNVEIRLSHCLTSKQLVYSQFKSKQHFFSLHCQGNRMRILFSHSVVTCVLYFLLPWLYSLHVQVISSSSREQSTRLIIISSSFLKHIFWTIMNNRFESYMYKSLDLIALTHFFSESLR